MESKDTTSKVDEQGLRNLKSDYFIQNFLDLCLKENI